MPRARRTQRALPSKPPQQAVPSQPSGQSSASIEAFIDPFERARRRSAPNAWI